MVKNSYSLKLKSGKIIKLKKKLNCKTFAIYAAECMDYRSVMSIMFDRR